MCLFGILFFKYLAEAGTSSNLLQTIIQTDNNAPQDISLKGQEKIEQNFHGQNFRKTNGRSFQPKWIESYGWIEYSKQLDGIFCYACRQFSIGNLRNDVFITTGFNNWKNALSAGQGLKKHESSSTHIKAMLSWNENEKRINQNQRISTLLNDVAIEKRRHYLKVIIRTIIFLAKNELPYRGNWDFDEKKETGLFNNLFQFTLERDEKLRDCQNAMPANSTYTSASIQNEVIHLIADVIRQKIILEINEASFYALLADGATDSNGIEILSIAFRYVKDAEPIETLLVFEKAVDISAVGLTKLIIDAIEKYRIDEKKIISQCYDGANVMSGSSGGIQTCLQQHYKRTIPYIHCCNHRLHLVVTEVVSKIDACYIFFGQVKLLHDFFNRFKVRREYEGSRIPLLIEQRWSGHFRAIQSIMKNYTQLLAALEKIMVSNDPTFTADDRALATGINNAMMEKKFVVMLHFLNELFGLLDPANKIL